MPLQQIYESDPAIAPEQYAGKLQGKVAVITGCSAGIGRSIAKAFAAAGAAVAVVARREADLLSLVAEIKEAGGSAIRIAADITKPGAAQAIVSQVEKELGTIDVLVNNAGIARIGTLAGEPEDLDIWWRVYEVNVRAPVALIRAVLPSMTKRGSGIVMSTSSDVATLPLPVMTAYASSKAAISKFHESLSFELEGTGVLSFAVHPGMVKTELGAPTNALNKNVIDHPKMKEFLGHIGSERKFQAPECCADLMVSLAADPRAAALTGHHINATQEITPCYEEAAKEGKGRIGAERLYLVNIASL